MSQNFRIGNSLLAERSLTRVRYAEPHARKYYLRFLAVFVVAAAQSAAPAFANDDAAQAKLIFRKRCMACHTFGKGIKVGPDLKGVTERRKRDWLVKFIQSSSSVIESKEAVAVKLFADFKRERMPDWSDLSLNEIQAIIEYLGANGPEQKEPDERHASSALVAEIEAGRQLFLGEKKLIFGGAACSTCHSLSKATGSGGGTLGPDLSDVYFRFQDKALTDFLKHPCILREPEISTGRYLTPQESFELKAYLAKAAASTPRKGQVAQSGPGATGRGGSFLKGGFNFDFWPYAALIVFAVGITGAMFRRGQRIGILSQLMDDNAFWRVNKWWLAAFVVLILGHLAGLLFPGEILLWNRVPVRLYLLEGTAIAAGLAALGGWACMMWRHLRRAPDEIGGQLADTVFLSFLFGALCCGLAAAVLYRWSSSWAVLTVTPYVRSVLRGQATTGLVVEMTFLVRLHIFCGLASAATLPFTSATPLFIQAARRVSEAVSGPVLGTAQHARRALSAWVAKHGLAARIWPEED